MLNKPSTAMIGLARILTAFARVELLLGFALFLALMGYLGSEKLGEKPAGSAEANPAQLERPLAD